jgi:hypothetical protein
MSRAIYPVPIGCVFRGDAHALQVKHAVEREGDSCCSLHLELERSAVTCADVTGLP